MKIDLRWQLLLVVICLAFVAFLLSYQIQTAGSCSVTAPTSGGRLTEGIVGLPRFVNPLLSDANPIDQELVDLIFDGLTTYDENGSISPALATSWSYSEDNKTITFLINERARWQDGQPVTANDVAFTFGLLQDENFPASEKLREFWQAVAIDIIDDSQISFTLPQPYSPFLDATTRGILPAHILERIPVEDVANHDFNQSPIGTGPFFVIPGNNWEEDGYLVLAPYLNHWRGGTILDALELRFYQDGSALQEAYEAGEILSINRISAEDIGVLGSLGGMQMFSTPSPRFSELIFNLTDSGATGIRSTRVRQALAMALDTEALADQVLSGQAVPLVGPYLPTSWAYDPGILTDYSYQPAQAAALLDAEGWLLLDGSEVRQKDGEFLKLRLLSGDSTVQLDLAQETARQWSELGIAVELRSVNNENLPGALNEREFDAALIDVAPLGDPDLYDFWSQEAIVKGQNYGGWNNRRASEALEAARGITNPVERKPYYTAFLQYLDEDLPALTLFQYVDTYGINEAVHDVTIGLINRSRDRFKTFDEWFLTYEDVSVICTDSATPESS